MAKEPMEVQVLATEARRKTLSVEVHPTGQVVIRAPLDCSKAQIQLVLKKRERWIAEQQAFFKRFEPRTPQRAWVAGESHLHLGRRYKLRVEISVSEGVAFSGRDLLVTLRPDAPATPQTIETQVLRWRHAQAKEIFERQLVQCHRHYRFSAFPQPALRVQQLVKRWGSLSQGGTMTLYSGLVQAPAACIDYVIYHELCHLAHADHSASFFALLAEVCPQWMARKQLLEATIC